MSLLEVELKSQWLRHQLQKPVSVRLKLLSIINFFTLFINENGQSKYISYYLQFENDIFSLILKNKFEYCTPDEIEELKRIVNQVFLLSKKTSEQEKKRLWEALETVRINITRILNDETFTDEIIEGSSVYSVNQVLIENDHQAAFHSDQAMINSGVIKKLLIDISENVLPDGKDKISFKNNYDDKQNDLQNELNKILRVVKTDLFRISRTMPRLSRPLSFSLSFPSRLGLAETDEEGRGEAFSGISMELGAALLIYNSIFRKNLHKIYYKFRNDVVFGSAIDKSGYLVPLDNEVLKLKLRTVFFSPYKKFVIPEDNIFGARKYLEELNKIYPDRKVQLIPVRHYLSIFKNLDVVEICKLKLKEKAKAHYKKYHIIVNSALSVLLLAILVVLTVNVIIPDLDHNPVYTELKDNRYVAYNKYGKKVWESNILSKDEIATFKNPENRAERIIISDLDNDGLNDILLTLCDEKDKLLNRTLTCYNYNGKVKWKTVIPYKDSLYGKDYCGDDIVIQNIILLNKNPNKEIIIAYRICSLFPCYITKIDYRGKIISDFYNPGYTANLISYDIDNDGNVELIAGGINNDLNKSAVIIVFDADFINGCAPGYRFPGGKVSTGLMKQYILLPRTDVGNFTNHGSSIINMLEIHKEGILASVREMDIFLDLKGKQQIQVYGTLYTLDKSLKITHVETSSEFDAKYQQLVKEGKLEPVKDWKKYKEELASRVKYWDGDKFVNYPVINKYYLQAKENKQKSLR